MSDPKAIEGQNPPKGDPAKPDTAKPPEPKAEEPKPVVPISKGDQVNVVVMVGGPALERIPGMVTRVHGGKGGSPPLLDVTTTNKNGVEQNHEKLPPENPEGSHLNGGCVFPCYARRG